MLRVRLPDLHDRLIFFTIQSMSPLRGRRRFTVRTAMHLAALGCSQWEKPIGKQVLATTLKRCPNERMEATWPYGHLYSLQPAPGGLPARVGCLGRLRTSEGGTE